MKNLLLLPVLVLAVHFHSFAQCSEEVILSASKTEYLNGSDVLQRTVDESSTIEISKTKVVIKPGNVDQVMIGTITSDTCNWKTPYTEGLTVIHASFDDPSAEPRHATLKVEGIAGKITFLMEIQEMPDRKIRVSIDKFAKK
ncbi:hypothetical protein GCM10007423_03220 [Dyadobacter endophyticus]|uniref:Lipocalin-like domain-containing protein n=1 Tax=Dyadobacter endophyticus TaxID=1749036 RepID=A0ABQ1YDX1_9BACT|nr:hypothetical protein [Dyadobacter endophyticus]GGH21820.1 hypothetical protein GCM10007423_03220 [Dyadobacter endophyticus]